MDATIGPDSPLWEVARERARQTAKHGDQSHLPDGTGPDLVLWGLPPSGRADDLATWAGARCKAASQNEGGDGTITLENILTEEWAEAIEQTDPAKLRAELIQVAAVAVQWVETIDRRAEAAEAVRPSGPDRAETRASEPRCLCEFLGDRLVGPCPNHLAVEAGRG